MTRAAPLPPDERRKAIIAATRPLLIASGGQFTTRQVAEAAGIAEGTIFRVFENKQELLAAVIDDTLDPTELCHQLRSLPTADDLVGHVARLIGLLRSDIDAVSAVATALHAVPGGTLPGQHRGHDETIRAQRTTAVTAALVTALQPFADQLRVPLPQAAALVRGMAMACGHPMLGATELGEAVTLAGLIVHGIYQPSPDKD